MSASPAVDPDVVVAQESGSRVCLSLDSVIGSAECGPELWQDCWQAMSVPHGLFVQLYAGVEGLAFELPLSKEGAGTFFRNYGKIHIEEGVGGSRAGHL